jgi:hypothetical protein
MEAGDQWATYGAPTEDRESTKRIRGREIGLVQTLIGNGGAICHKGFHPNKSSLEKDGTSIASCKTPTNETETENRCWKRFAGDLPKQ